MEFTRFFPAGETSFNIPIGITDDEITLEEVEIVIVSLRLNNPPSTVELGSLDMTSIEIVDNDGEYCVCSLKGLGYGAIMPITMQREELHH